MTGACLVVSAMALSIKHYLKKQNAKFEEEEASGMMSHGYIQGSRTGHGGDAVVAFRYVH